MEQNKNFKSGYVAIAGKPNVGKSTLINDYMECKLSIVTPKPQTTRKKIMGVLTKDNYQIVFFDTPGIMEPKYELQKYMVNEAYAAIEDADVVLMMAEPFEPASEQDKEIFNKLFKLNIPIILAINKIDLVEKDSLIPVIAAYGNQFKFAEIVPISALKGTNLDLLQSLIVKYLPEGDPFYPEDYITDSATIEIEEFKEREKGKNFIRAIIYVERDSQKGIIIGENSKAIKHVGVLAREEIEKQLDRS